MVHIYCRSDALPIRPTSQQWQSTDGNAMLWPWSRTLILLYELSNAILRPFLLLLAHLVRLRYLYINMLNKFTVSIILSPAGLIAFAIQLTSKGVSLSVISRQTVYFCCLHGIWIISFHALILLSFVVLCVIIRDILLHLSVRCQLCLTSCVLRLWLRCLVLVSQ